MKKNRLVTLAVVFLSCASARAVTIPWALVGDPGNAADPATGNLYGSVDHTYQISATEVTNTQYAEFLNAVDPTGANTLELFSFNFNEGIFRDLSAAAGSKYSALNNHENHPITRVNWNGAARFANWLNNGQGSGSTETGAYDMTQTNPSRAANATVFLPTEDEWYKAAYYDPTLNGAAGGYYTYATKSNTPPLSQSPRVAFDSSNSANYYNYDGNLNDHHNNGYAVTGQPIANPNQDYLTDVSAYSASTSYYGTFDQNGNVWEWNETLIAGADRGLRGGAWVNDAGFLAASYGNHEVRPTLKADGVGFRVASVAPPVPTGILNGGFEAPTLGFDSHVQFRPGDSVWTWAGDAGIINAPSIFVAPEATDGEQLAFLQLRAAAGTVSSFSQNFLQPSDGLFALTFFEAGRGPNFPGHGGIVPYQVLLDSVVIYTGTTLTSQPFTFESSLPFALTAGSHVLEFRATQTSGDNMAFFDSVQLQAVPEPSPAILVLIGSGIVSYCIRRKQA